VNNISIWIEHLHHPLVFSGIGVFVLSSVIGVIAFFLRKKRAEPTSSQWMGDRVQ
jgi:hypothetical protein